MEPDRRTVATGLLAAAGLPARSEAAPRPDFDYLFLPGAAAAEEASRGLAEAGAIIVGRFTPQLGWASDESALLVGWSAGATPAATRLRGQWARSQSGIEPYVLTPTARPTVVSPAKPGGIYVHRWFTVPAEALDEFVALSVEGWRDFEARFDANIYGLFLASSGVADVPDGARRLPLLTRYASHGVWEESRDPTTEAMAAFRRRRALTRRTWAASTLLATAPGAPLS
jgi:hypothetical protein